LTCCASGLDTHRDSISSRFACRSLAGAAGGPLQPQLRRQLLGSVRQGCLRAHMWCAGLLRAGERGRQQRRPRVRLPKHSTIFKQLEWILYYWTQNFWCIASSSLSQCRASDRRPDTLAYCDTLHVVYHRPSMAYISASVTLWTTGQQSGLSSRLDYVIRQIAVLFLAHASFASRWHRKIVIKQTATPRIVSKQTASRTASIARLLATG
jgi:hypothetical protein